jgi:tetratricopeptide (TPR) repeat protein
LQRVPKNMLESRDEIEGKPRGIWTSLGLSYDMLPSDEQALFRQISILLSPASAEDIAVITETPNPRPVLDALVKRSLVRMREGAYSLLPIVRDYAQGKLADANQDPLELHTRAVNHYGQKNTLEGALTASDHLFELAVRFASPNSAEAFVGYLAGFYKDLITRSYLAEARNKTEQLIVVARMLGDKQIEAQALGEIGSYYHRIGEYERAAELHLNAFSIFKETKDDRGVAVALHQLGVLARSQGNYNEAARLYRQSLEISIGRGDKNMTASTLGDLGILAKEQGDYSGAARLCQQCLNIKEELGEKLGIAVMLNQLGDIRHLQGNFDEATQMYRQSLKMQEDLGYRGGVAASLKGLGDVAHHQGNRSEAVKLYQQSLEIEKALGDKRGIARLLHQLGMLAQEQGDYTKAARLYRQSLNIKEEMGDKNEAAYTLGQLGQFYCVQGQMKEALSYSLKALALFEELRSPNRQLALKDIASIREAVGEEQFAAWLRELSTEAERINALVKQKETEDEQQAKEFVEQLIGVAEAVVAARKQGSAEERDELAQELAQAETGAREQNMPEVADFLAVLRGLLAGENVAEKIAALDEPLKGIAEQARAACE